MYISIGTYSTDTYDGGAAGIYYMSTCTGDARQLDVTAAVAHGREFGSGIPAYQGTLCAHRGVSGLGLLGVLGPALVLIQISAGRWGQINFHSTRNGAF